MIKVAVAGALGRMGQTVCESVNAADDMELICGIDPHGSSDTLKLFASVDEALDTCEVDVLVDFTRPDVVAGNIKAALSRGVNCVIGTTGLTEDVLEALAGEARDDATLFYAPNFTTGAVLMMQFAKAAAPFFPEAEVIEMHHAKKLDAPSGTAVRTAQMIARARDFESDAPGAETEIEGAKGARGALVEGVPVHSVRSMGYVASQEVIFGSFGQSLTIRHDSWDRHSYMPGVLLGIRSVQDTRGLIIGLEQLMGL